jgi:hypothetical protein
MSTAVPRRLFGSSHHRPIATIPLSLWYRDWNSLARPVIALSDREIGFGDEGIILVKAGAGVR